MNFRERFRLTQQAGLDLGKKNKQITCTWAPLSTHPALIGIILAFLANNVNRNAPTKARVMTSRL